MGEQTQKRVAELYLQGYYQNDANVDTIKQWVDLYFPKKEEPKKEKVKKK
jgi:hypothetical protein